ncbi:unnamed protein product [Pedinophyceae sp. YPF-701]|nr:unnamed protein product [Pedinophyceae sp. YPF-701]
MADKQLNALLKEHAGHLERTESGRVRCTLNDHVMPARLDIVRAFVGGKKFKKMIADKEEDAAIKNLEPFMVPSRNFPGKLYCTLTSMVLVRSLESARNHMKGRRFLMAKERFMNDEEEMVSEPDLDADPDVISEDTQGAAPDETGGEEEGGMEGVWVPDAYKKGAVDGDGDTPMEQDEGAGGEAAEGQKQKGGGVKGKKKKKSREEKQAEGQALRSPGGWADAVEAREGRKGRAGNGVHERPRAKSGRDKKRARKQ